MLKKNKCRYRYDKHPDADQQSPYNLKRGMFGRLYCQQRDSGYDKN